MSPAICWRTKASQSEKGLWPGGLPGLFFCPREHGGPSSHSRQRSRSAPKGGERNNSPAAQARGNGTTSRPPTSRVSVLTPHTRREPSPPPPSRRSVTHVLGLFCYLCLRVVPCSPHRSLQLSGPFTGLMVRPAVVRLVSETGATPLPLFSPLQRASNDGAKLAPVTRIRSL